MITGMLWGILSRYLTPFLVGFDPQRHLRINWWDGTIVLSNVRVLPEALQPFLPETVVLVHVTVEKISFRLPRVMFKELHVEVVGVRVETADKTCARGPTGDEHRGAPSSASRAGPAETTRDSTGAPPDPTASGSWEDDGDFQSTRSGRFRRPKRRARTASGSHDQKAIESEDEDEEEGEDGDDDDEETDDGTRDDGVDDSGGPAPSLDAMGGAYAPEEPSYADHIKSTLLASLVVEVRDVAAVHWDVSPAAAVPGRPASLCVVTRAERIEFRSCGCPPECADAQIDPGPCRACCSSAERSRTCSESPLSWKCLLLRGCSVLVLNVTRQPDLAERRGTLPVWVPGAGPEVELDPLDDADLLNSVPPATVLCGLSVELVFASCVRALGESEPAPSGPLTGALRTVLRSLSLTSLSSAAAANSVPDPSGSSSAAPGGGGGSGATPSLVMRYAVLRVLFDHDDGGPDGLARAGGDSGKAGAGRALPGPGRAAGVWVREFDVRALVWLSERLRGSPPAGDVDARAPADGTGMASSQTAELSDVPMVRADHFAVAAGGAAGAGVAPLGELLVEGVEELTGGFIGAADVEIAPGIAPTEPRDALPVAPAPWTGGSQSAVDLGAAGGDGAHGERKGAARVAGARGAAAGGGVPPSVNASLRVRARPMQLQWRLAVPRAELTLVEQCAVIGRAPLSLRSRKDGPAPRRPVVTVSRALLRVAVRGVSVSGLLGFGHARGRLGMFRPAFVGCAHAHVGNVEAFDLLVAPRRSSLDPHVPRAQQRASPAVVLLCPDIDVQLLQDPRSWRALECGAPMKAGRVPGAGGAGAPGAGPDPGRASSHPHHQHGSKDRAGATDSPHGFAPDIPPEYDESAFFSVGPDGSETERTESSLTAARKDDESFDETGFHSPRGGWLSASEEEESDEDDEGLRDDSPPSSPAGLGLRDGGPALVPPTLHIRCQAVRAVVPADLLRRVVLLSGQLGLKPPSTAAVPGREAPGFQSDTGADSSDRSVAGHRADRAPPPHLCVTVAALEVAIPEPDADAGPSSDAPARSVVRLESGPLRLVAGHAGAARGGSSCAACGRGRWCDEVVPGLASPGRSRGSLVEGAGGLAEGPALESLRDCRMLVRLESLSCRVVLDVAPHWNSAGAFGAWDWVWDRDGGDGPAPPPLLEPVTGEVAVWEPVTEAQPESHRLGRSVSGSLSGARGLGRAGAREGVSDAGHFVGQSAAVEVSCCGPAVLNVSGPRLAATLAILVRLGEPPLGENELAWNPPLVSWLDGHPRLYPDPPAVQQQHAAAAAAHRRRPSGLPTGAGTLPSWGAGSPLLASSSPGTGARRVRAVASTPAADSTRTHLLLSCGPLTVHLGGGSQWTRVGSLVLEGTTVQVTSGSGSRDDAQSSRVTLAFSAVELRASEGLPHAPVRSLLRIVAERERHQGSSGPESAAAAPAGGPGGDHGRRPVNRLHSVRSAVAGRAQVPGVPCDALVIGYSLTRRHGLSRIPTQRLDLRVESVALSYWPELLGRIGSVMEMPGIVGLSAAAEAHLRSLSSAELRWRYLVMRHEAARLWTTLSEGLELHETAHDLPGCAEHLAPHRRQNHRRVAALLAGRQEVAGGPSGRPRLVCVPSRAPVGVLTLTDISYYLQAVVGSLNATVYSASVRVPVPGAVDALALQLFVPSVSVRSVPRAGFHFGSQSFEVRVPSVRVLATTVALAEHRRHPNASVDGHHDIQWVLVAEVVGAEAVVLSLMNPPLSRLRADGAGAGPGAVPVGVHQSGSGVAGASAADGSGERRPPPGAARAARARRHLSTSALVEEAALSAASVRVDEVRVWAGVARLLEWLRSAASSGARVAPDSREEAAQRQNEIDEERLPPAGALTPRRRQLSSAERVGAVSLRFSVGSTCVWLMHDYGPDWYRRAEASPDWFVPASALVAGLQQRGPAAAASAAASGAEFAASRASRLQFCVAEFRNASVQYCRASLAGPGSAPSAAPPRSDSRAPLLLLGIELQSAAVAHLESAYPALDDPSASGAAAASGVAQHSAEPGHSAARSSLWARLGPISCLYSRVERASGGYSRSLDVLAANADVTAALSGMPAVWVDANIFLTQLGYVRSALAAAAGAGSDSGAARGAPGRAERNNNRWHVEVALGPLSAVVTGLPSVRGTVDGTPRHHSRLATADALGRARGLEELSGAPLASLSVLVDGFWAELERDDASPSLESLARAGRARQDLTGRLACGPLRVVALDRQGCEVPVVVLCDEDCAWLGPDVRSGEPGASSEHVGEFLASHLPPYTSCPASPGAAAYPAAPADAPPAQAGMVGGLPPLHQLGSLADHASLGSQLRVRGHGRDRDRDRDRGDRVSGGPLRVSPLGRGGSVLAADGDSVHGARRRLLFADERRASEDDFTCTAEGDAESSRTWSMTITRRVLHLAESVPTAAAAAPRWDARVRLACLDVFATGDVLATACAWVSFLGSLPSAPVSVAATVETAGGPHPHSSADRSRDHRNEQASAASGASAAELHADLGGFHFAVSAAPGSTTGRGAPQPLGGRSQAGEFLLLAAGPTEARTSVASRSVSVSASVRGVACLLGTGAGTGAAHADVESCAFVGRTAATLQLSGHDALAEGGNMFAASRVSWSASSESASLAAGSVGPRRARSWSDDGGEAQLRSENTFAVTRGGATPREPATSELGLRAERLEGSGSGWPMSRQFDVRVVALGVELVDLGDSGPERTSVPREAAAFEPVLARDRCALVSLPELSVSVASPAPSWERPTGAAAGDASPPSGVAAGAEAGLRVVTVAIDAEQPLQAAFSLERLRRAADVVAWIPAGPGATLLRLSSLSGVANVENAGTHSDVTVAAAAAAPADAAAAARPGSPAQEWRRMVMRCSPLTAHWRLQRSVTRESVAEARLRVGSSTSRLEWTPGQPGEPPSVRADATAELLVRQRVQPGLPLRELLRLDRVVLGVRTGGRGQIGTPVSFDVKVTVPRPVALRIDAPLVRLLAVLLGARTHWPFHMIVARNESLVSVVLRQFPRIVGGSAASGGGGQWLIRDTRLLPGEERPLEDLGDLDRAGVSVLVTADFHPSVLFGPASLVPCASARPPPPNRAYPLRAAFRLPARESSHSHSAADVWLRLEREPGLLVLVIERVELSDSRRHGPSRPALDASGGERTGGGGSSQPLRRCDNPRVPRFVSRPASVDDADSLLVSGTAGQGPVSLHPGAHRRSATSVPEVGVAPPKAAAAAGGVGASTVPTKQPVGRPARPMSRVQLRFHFELALLVLRAGGDWRQGHRAAVVDGEMPPLAELSIGGGSGTLPGGFRSQVNWDGDALGLQRLETGAVQLDVFPADASRRVRIETSADVSASSGTSAGGAVSTALVGDVRVETYDFGRLVSTVSDLGSALADLGGPLVRAVREVAGSTGRSRERERGRPRPWPGSSSRAALRVGPFTVVFCHASSDDAKVYAVLSLQSVRIRTFAFHVPALAVSARDGSLVSRVSIARLRANLLRTALGHTGSLVAEIGRGWLRNALVCFFQRGGLPSSTHGQ